MPRATPQLRDFAERLIAYEAGRVKSPGTSPPVAFPVCERLRPHLAALMGSTGVYALFLRALTISRNELDSLHTVQVKADGSLDRADALEAQADPEEFAEGSVVLVAQLLGLLIAFIGENLTFRLVHDVWPQVPPQDSGFPKGVAK